MASKSQSLFDLHSHNINAEAREIYLHSHYVDDEYGEEPGVEYRQATTFIKNLHFLDKPDYLQILVHLHSQGGSWDDGMAIFDTIKFCRSPLIMLAYSQASSMSGIILQSAPIRIMMPNCHFLMHHGQAGGSMIHPFALKNEADFQFIACRKMLQIFSERAMVGPHFKKCKSATPASVFRFFDKKIKNKVDWYMDAEEAVYYGLADDILGSSTYPTMGSLRERKDANEFTK